MLPGDCIRLFFFAQTGSDGFSDIREIVEYPNYAPWLIAATVLLAAAGGTALWRRCRRKRETALPAAPAEEPHQKARRLLEALRRDGHQLEAEPFTVEVSRILRVYLEEALRIPAQEQTSEEFLSGLRDQTWPSAELRAELEEFMRLADLVKFARQSLSSSQRAGLLDSALQVVERTEPNRSSQTPPNPNAAEVSRETLPATATAPSDR